MADVWSYNFQWLVGEDTGTFFPADVESLFVYRAEKWDNSRKHEMASRFLTEK